MARNTKIISVFNNKGGVGKTTLTFHLGNILAEKGFRVLMIDLDPQCNLTLFTINENEIEDIWTKEDDFIDERGFEESKNKDLKNFTILNNEPRSIHYLLKPTEEGTGELTTLPPPYNYKPNIDIIPGRLSLHMYEYKISERWNGAYRGDPLSIRTITRIRELALLYAQNHHYDFVIIDTSPSLGALNKTIISNVDGFFIPNNPDLFSLYGIRNIGKALSEWKKEIETIYKLISDEKRSLFPKDFVRFLGFTIYNAKKYEGRNKWDLPVGHYNYAEKIPETIKKYIPKEVRSHLTDDMINEPIGGKSIMHTHNTFPGMAQKYKLPFWLVPSHGSLDIAENEKSSILGNRAKYENTKNLYSIFADDLLERIKTLD